MTNEMMAAEPALSGANVGEAMSYVCVSTVDFMSTPSVGWLISMILVLVISAAVFVQGLVARRRGGELFWHPRVLVLVGLITGTSTLVAAITTLHDVLYYYTATQSSGAAQQAMLRLNIADACAEFRVGILATAFCFGLAVILPTRRKEPPTTGGTVRR